MKVIVLDQDDNNPVFVKNNITKGVRVNADIYTHLETVKAVDIDANADTITYHLVNVTFYRPREGEKKVRFSCIFRILKIDINHVNFRSLEL